MTIHTHSPTCTCGHYKKIPATLNNAGMRKHEYDFAERINILFSRQYDKAMSRNVIDTMDVGWLTDPEEIGQFDEAAFPIIKIEAQLAGKLAGQKIGIQMPDFIDRPRVIAALKDESYLFARSVNVATAEKLKQQLVKGMVQGESIPELKRRVQAVFAVEDAERAISWRAERIARTETAQAYSVGTTAQWKESAVVESVKWVASSNACPFCADMDGEEVGIGKNFWEQGDMMIVPLGNNLGSLRFDYRSVSGPPLHPNCRCALNAVFIDIKR